MVTLTESEIRERISAIANRKGQSKVASYFGVSQSYMSRYLKSTRPLPKKIAQRLGAVTTTSYVVNDDVLDSIESSISNNAKEISNE